MNEEIFWNFPTLENFLKIFPTIENILKYLWYLHSPNDENNFFLSDIYFI